MARVIYITDFDMKGSGYFNICTNLADGLHKRGHDVMVLGLSYKDEEHPYSFSVLPARDMPAIAAMYQNLVPLWQPQVVILAMDIPITTFLYSQLSKFGVPWISITALESGPLCQTWTIGLSQIRKLFFISEYGAEEARRVMLDAEHLWVGMDWKQRTEEDYTLYRDILLGVTDPDTFVILQVADNQERKNIAGAMEIVAEFSKRHSNTKYVLLTRPDNQVGWRLRDLVQTLGIQKQYVELERGWTQEQLWRLYAASDVMISTSKGEGLGLPVLEAMAVGLPVIGSQVGATTELLADQRGWLVGDEYSEIDAYGNARRYYVNKKQFVEVLEYVQSHPEERAERAAASRKYIEDERRWDRAVEQINTAIGELVNEQAQPAQSPSV